MEDFVHSTLTASSRGTVMGDVHLWHKMKTPTTYGRSGNLPLGKWLAVEH